MEEIFFLILADIIAS